MDDYVADVRASLVCECVAVVCPSFPVVLGVDVCVDENVRE